MTFYDQEKPYRVTFDLEQNVFVVYSTITGQQGTGITIEQAIYDGMATLFLTKIIRCCECCGVMAPIAL
ncbi:hypothetical protein ABQD95_20385, partial [Enterococcus avium]|uniref:hypothetical protein n=1 Tax=Enterococcus avium TaxID=33945 RepID=UPI0032E452FE